MFVFIAFHPHTERNLHGCGCGLWFSSSVSGSKTRSHQTSQAASSGAKLTASRAILLFDGPAVVVGGGLRTVASLGNILAGGGGLFSWRGLIQDHSTKTMFGLACQSLILLVSMS